YREKLKKIDFKNDYNNLISSITNEIYYELPLKERIILLINLIEFNKYSESLSIKSQISDISDFEIIKKISDYLLIPDHEYFNITGFIYDTLYKIPQKDRILLINDNTKSFISGIKHIINEDLSGQIFILQVRSANIFLMRYKGNDFLEINNKKIFPHHLYLLNAATLIKGEKIKPIYFNDIVRSYIDETEKTKIFFIASDIEFCFKNSENGIHRFNFKGESGQMFGIMGGSGVGKSTLLNMLNGKLPLNNGEIYINGLNIHQVKKKLEGIIGYIPQDDLLIEELTVYQNLYFNAQLCFGDKTKIDIHEIVKNVLVELDLFEIKDLKVGSPINKFISGGQRKRLNIALELIREPYVLFIDEPTSGLSSTDSLNVMQLLQEQALNGKFVIINIHQPSSQTFKMFDKLLVLDKGGYPVYFGNPVEGIEYFKKTIHKVSGTEGECPVCGNLNPEEILEILEEKDVNEYGEFIEKRKISPKEWYTRFLENINIQITNEDKQENKLPKSNFIIPGKLKQFKIYSFRNLFSKIKDSQYLFMAFSIPPLLAFILGFFTKYVFGTDQNPYEYIFSKNENLPGYLFMCVVVALFLGLIISAEEIIRDRRILERESFLNLSRFSYLNSKIIFLFIMSAIQMIIFVVIGNLILEIKGMTWSFFLILFSTACFANLMGLVISSGLKSVIAIYILVPFLLVPQLLLSGTIVKFDKLHYTLSSQQFVPLVGDIMASRWAYEALMVNQYKNNEYQKYFFDIERDESIYSYKLRNLIPDLEVKLEECRENLDNKDTNITNTDNNFKILQNELLKLNFNRPMPFLNSLNSNLFSKSINGQVIQFLEKQKAFLNTKLISIKLQKDYITEKLLQTTGNIDNYVKFKNRYYNESIADLVLNNNEFRIIYQYKNKLIWKSDPIYKYPESNIGRAHFYASVKILLGNKFDTLTFNAMIIWLMTFVLYIILITDSFKKLMESSNILIKRVKVTHTKLQSTI
ncbi:MAG: ATP-binding cassette domain-containing protein, partial [Bacteroidales bacterium]|nr:ATP-binding cassette domain-containing protein [Bacteroidales bacterium]